MKTAANAHPSSEQSEGPAQTNAPKTSHVRIFVALFLILLFLSVSLAAVRTSRLYYTWQDDIYMGVLADHVKTEGFKTYWDWTGSYARWQGRLYFYFSFIFFIGPYLTNSAFVRTAIIVFAQVASIGVTGFFLSLYLTRIGGLLFTAGTLCLLPHWLSLYPTTTNMLVYHVPILFFFSGISVYVILTRTPGVARGYSVMLQSLTFVFVFASLYIYEVLAVPFFLITASVVWSELRREKRRVTLPIIFRTALPFVCIFVLWAVSYLGYRLLHPPSYEGAKLAPFVLRVFAADVWRHLVKSLPGANAVVMLPWAEYRARGLLFSVSKLSTSEFLQAILIGSVVFLGMFCYSERVGPKAQKRLVNTFRLKAICSIALLSAILQPIPMSLTEKYRNWPWEQTPYLPDYYAYLAFMAAVTVALLAIYRFATASVRTSGAVIFALLFTFFTASGSIANDRVNSIQARDSKKWKLVDLLCTTGVLRDLPQDAVVLAPTLWVGIEPNWWFAKDYWSRYLETRLHRPIRVIRSIEDLRGDLRKTRHLYYWEQEWTSGNSESTLSLMPISIDDLHLDLTGKLLTIVSDHDLPDTQLELRTINSETPSRLNLPRLSYQGGGFVGVIEVPGLIAGSVELVGESKPEIHAALLPIEFERGFSNVEFSGDRYWRWSDGESGEGSLAIEDTIGTPIAVKFKTKFLTGGVPRQCVVTFRGDQESVSVLDGQLFEREWLLQPGRNQAEIKCNGPRISAPNDPRVLIFGLEGWGLTPLPNRPPRQ
ncbi:MAG TPA: hypothetical protein VKU01_00145 [Bryobacteraceae bacterium]|nr:hypothetical protein [Bryobacteraceae bacterium]